MHVYIFPKCCTSNLRLPETLSGLCREKTKAVMAFEVAHGMQKAAMVLAQAMTKLQVQRLAKEEGFDPNTVDLRASELKSTVLGLDPGSFFQPAEEAIQWLVHA